MVPKVLKVKFMKIQQDQLCSLFLKVIMQQSLLMDRQVQVKHLQWKVLNITKVILKEVSFLELWKRYLDIYRIFRINSQLLWLEHLTCKYITKTYLIY